MNESRVRLIPSLAPSPRHARLLGSRVRPWVAPGESDQREPAVAVYLTPRALQQLAEHVVSDMDNEVGGVLVGRWMVAGATREQFILVESTLPARHVRQGSTFITFTQQSLVTLNDELEERHPGRRMVGWYHTHPRMGIFLSGYDTWLHEHFFPEAWQTALVVEPHSAACGFFVRDAEGRLDSQRYVGFREILGRSGQSVVHWRNLTPSVGEENGGGLT